MILALILILVVATYGIVIERRMKRLDKMINELRVGINEDVFNIYWTQPLTAYQKNLIAMKMISKFSPACRPSSIRVSDVAQVVFQTPCMTEEQLTNIGNSFMADNHETNTVAKVVKIGI